MQICTHRWCSQTSSRFLEEPTAIGSVLRATGAVHTPATVVVVVVVAVVILGVMYNRKMLVDEVVVGVVLIGVVAVGR